MNIDLKTGLIESIKFIKSDNCDLRPESMAIDLLVIHGISLPAGEFGGAYIHDLFTNQLDKDAHSSFKELCELRVSAHLLIDRQGNLFQFVPLTKRAWHAGVSEFGGRSHCNDFSIGIELEGTDELPYQACQYQQLAVVTRALMKAYPEINSERIVGHSDIAPDRKTDPGPEFAWNDYFKLIKENE